MPTFDIIRTATPQKSFRVAAVMGTYDLQDNSVTEHFSGELALPEKWSIGLIVGSSGTGKTTIAKELFPQAYIGGFEYTHDNILDDFPQGIKVSDICKTLSQCGFSSPPSWLKPYAVLSQGEKMRCDLARSILNENKLFVFDEFTSVVDRQVAKIASFCVQKAIRRTDKQFIAVACHRDIEEWLLPDWVFDTNNMTFRTCESQKKNKPAVELRIYETTNKEYFWHLFRRYHYLGHSFNKAARAFVATANGELCAFTSFLRFPHPHVKNYFREHRTVVFPDYQGIGIGQAVSDFVARKLQCDGFSVVSTTSNPAKIVSMIRSENWNITHYGRLSTGGFSGFQRKDVKNSTSASRNTVSFKLKVL